MVEQAIEFAQISRLCPRGEAAGPVADYGRGELCANSEIKVPNTSGGGNFSYLWTAGVVAHGSFSDV
jgi:hypothetical protein